MLRNLFLRELRRSWLAHAALLVVVAGTATVLEHALSEGPPDPEDQLTLTQLLLIGLVVSGLISGERCFSKAFKDGRYPFLLSLPEPRGRIWLAYLGGRFCGALAALPAVLPVRPILLDQVFLSPQDPAKPSLLFAMLAMYPAVFFGGALLALAVRKEILVYLAGVPVLSALLGLLALSATYGFDSTSLSENPHFLRDFSFGSLGLALVEALLARRAFCRGELNLGRRMARTLAEVGLASLAFVVLALAVFSSTSLTALRDEWQPDPGFPDSESLRPVSADGRFLVIVQQLQARPHFKRLAVVDLKSGRSSRWMEQPGIHQVSWSSSGAVLNVLATDDAFPDEVSLHWGGSTSWYRLAPDLQTLSTRKFQGVRVLRPLAHGDLLLATKQWTVGTVYLLSGRDGGFRRILASELSDEPSLWSLAQGSAVVFPQSNSLRAWWLDAEGRIRHQESVKWSPLSYAYYLLGYRILSSEDVWTEIIRRAYNPRSSRPGEPLLPSRNAFWELRRPSSFSDGIQFKAVESEMDLKNGSLDPLIFKTLDGKTYLSPTASFDLDAETWTWSATGPLPGKQQLFLYDGQLGRTIPNRVSCSGFRSAELKRVQGLDGLLVQYECQDRPGRRFLRLVPGSGFVQELPWLSASVPPDLFDRWIYLDPDGTSVWASARGEVWQVTPGNGSRRLNPPETN